ncbi:MAG: polysaccharide biosynthesis C-terminal domain-containing protein [Candidatus Limnocylindrales bacterium]|jgi:O-antigen/teichoic acid export membrane protein
MTSSSGQGSTFARRVTAVFSTNVVIFALALLTTVVVSRILGPQGKGAYVAVIALPGMLGAIGVFGLPGAINYFSARGASVTGLLRASIVLATVISVFTMAIVWALLPWLEQSVLRDAPDDMLRVIVFTVPANTLSTFGAAILYGRQRVRTYTSILVAQAVATTVLSIALVGPLHFGVPGAVTASLVTIWLLAIAVVIAVWRLGGSSPPGDPVSYRPLTAYGLRFIPASITGYFNYRIDTFLIQALMVGPAALGQYSIAVTMAELVFYIPDSVTIIFLPRVAGASRQGADAMLPRVSRLTSLLTVGSAIALIPVAWIGIHLVLPQYIACLPAFYVLLPAVVSLSLSKVMTSFISGRGRPGAVSVGATVTLVVNVAANVVLIPMYGIVGAALASLLSYSAMAAMMVVVACRLSHNSPLAVIVPGPAEVRLLIATARRGAVATRAIVARHGRPGAAGPPAASDAAASHERP